MARYSRGPPFPSLSSPPFPPLILDVIEDPVSLYLVLLLVFVGAASHAARKQRHEDGAATEDGATEAAMKFPLPFSPSPCPSPSSSTLVIEDPVSLYLVLLLVFVGAASHAARKQRHEMAPRQKRGRSRDEVSSPLMGED